MALLAGAVAFFAWGRPVQPTTFIGYLLICSLVVVLVREKVEVEQGEGR